MLSEVYAGSLGELTGLESSWNFISPLLLGGVTLRLIVLDFWKLLITKLNLLIKKFIFFWNGMVLHLTHITQYLNRSVKSCRTAEYNQQDATFHNLFISIRSSTYFRGFFRQSPGAQNCTYSVRYLSDQYCYLLLAGQASSR